MRNFLYTYVPLIIKNRYKFLFLFPVLGPVKFSELGRTLTHEHLALDFHKFYVPPPAQLADYFTGKIDLGNVGFLKQYP